MITKNDIIVPSSKPWIGIKIVGGEPHVEGHASCKLGTRIPVAGKTLAEGVFAEWNWDGRRLSVCNDRYGFYPLFYCAKHDSIWVSPSLERVMTGNSNRQLDWPALAIFYRLLHFIGDDTPFSDIRLLSPNTRLVWEGGNLSLQVQPHNWGNSKPGDYSFDDAVESYRELFQQAVARRLPEDDRFTVPISGGRDSRHILLELVRQGARPRYCHTLKYRPPATNEDYRIAHLLTGRLGIQHVEIDRPSSHFEASLVDIHLTNHCVGGHAWVLPLASAVDGVFECLYDGLAGDILSAGFLLDNRKNSLFRKQGFDELASIILSENSHEATMRDVFSDDFYRHLSFEEAVARLVPELRKHACAPNPILSFLFGNRTRRSVAMIPFAILHRMRHVHVPFLDHDLFDFLFSLDPSVVEGNRLHDETIRRSYPALADVPYEDKRVKAVFGPGDRTYFPAARREFLDYLWRCPREAAEVIRRPRIIFRVAGELLLQRIESPWYMRHAMQAVELQRLLLGN